MNNTQLSNKRIINKKSLTRVGRRIFSDRWLYFMLTPCIFYFLIFKYGPMLGLIAAFQNYQPFLGFTGSKWVGFANFIRFFQDPEFLTLLRNTVILGLYNLIFFFPLPLVISLMLNEIRNTQYKRFVQTLIYIPHFLSWVVIASITFTLLNTQTGAINSVISSIFGIKISFLSSQAWFRPLITTQVIWKETGWGTIIFLAALTGIDPELYDVAEIDGAGRWKQLLHITLPAIRGTIIILLILRLGSFLDSGFEQILLMLNPLNQNVGDVFDTYVYSMGILNGQLSYSVAVGLFKSVAALILVLGSNEIAKKCGEEGIY